MPKAAASHHRWQSPGYRLFALASLGVVAFYGLAALAALAHLGIGLQNDTANFMHVVQRMMAGEVPCIDFLELNPPFTILFFLPPTWLAEIFNLPDYWALNLFAGALSLLSLGMVFLIARQSRLSRPLCHVITSACALTLFGLSFQHQIYADREYMVMLLMMPLMLLYSPLIAYDRVGRRARTGAALMAAVGLCVKPYYMVLYGISVLGREYITNSYPKWRGTREDYLIMASGVLYAGSVWVFMPACIDAASYLSQAHRAFSWGWQNKLYIIQHVLVGTYGLPGLLLGVILWVLYAPSRRLMLYLSMLLLGTLCSYAISGGWYYVQFPSMVMAFLLCVAGMVYVCIIMNEKPGKILGSICLAMLVLAGSSVWHHTAAPNYQRAMLDRFLMQQRGWPLDRGMLPTAVMQRLIPYLDAHPRFAYLGMNVWASAIVQQGRPWKHIGYYEFIWPMAAILNPPSHPDMAQRFNLDIAHNLTTRRPDLLIVDVSPHSYRMPENFDLMRWLEAFPESRHALQAYQMKETIQTCTKEATTTCAYRIYLRTADGGGGRI